MYQLDSEKVLFTQLGEEGVLFHVEKNEYFSTNETMTKIVLGLQNQLNTEQIVQSLLEEFDIDEATCLTSVTNMLVILEQKGFIAK
ncbi:PqqD family protein [Aquirufa sp. ROCK-SH2]